MVKVVDNACVVGHNSKYGNHEEQYIRDYRESQGMSIGVEKSGGEGLKNIKKMLDIVTPLMYNKNC